MSELQAQQERLAKAIANRMQELLTHDEAKKHYQSFENEADAQEWLMKTALVTLVVPISERQAQ
jgi:hypothetical protein